MEVKNKYFDKFVKSFALKDVKAMKEAYDVLSDFDGQQTCLDFYVEKVTERLEM